MIRIKAPGESLSYKKDGGGEGGGGEDRHTFKGLKKWLVLVSLRVFVLEKSASGAVAAPAGY